MTDSKTLMPQEKLSLKSLYDNTLKEITGGWASKIYEKYQTEINGFGLSDLREFRLFCNDYVIWHRNMINVLNDMHYHFKKIGKKDEVNLLVEHLKELVEEHQVDQFEEAIRNLRRELNQFIKKRSIKLCFAVAKRHSNQGLFDVHSC